MAVANFERLFPGTIGFEADEKSQGLAVVQDENGFCVLPTTAGERPYGLIVSWAPKNKVAGIGLTGGFKYPARAAAAFPINSLLSVDTTGRLKVAAASGEFIFARAEEAATKEDDIVTVILLAN